MCLKSQRDGLIPAQGNALGKWLVPLQALKGRPNFKALERPYRFFFIVDIVPRALPWAVVGSPLRGC